MRYKTDSVDHIKHPWPASPPRRLVLVHHRALIPVPLPCLSPNHGLLCEVGVLAKARLAFGLLSTPPPHYMCSFGCWMSPLFFFHKTWHKPFVRDYMAKNHSARFERAFGRRRAKSMMEATAGSMIGVGEVGQTEAAASIVVRAHLLLRQIDDDRLRKQKVQIAQHSTQPNPTAPFLHAPSPPSGGNQQHNAYTRITHTDRTPPARCPQDQGADQPGEPRRPRRRRHLPERGEGPLPRGGLDRRSKRSRVIRALRWRLRGEGVRVPAREPEERDSVPDLLCVYRRRGGEVCRVCVFSALF